VVKIVENIKNNNNSVKLVMKQNSTVECISEDSNPPAEFNWYLGKPPSPLLHSPQKIH
jgi:hypothetical protein